MDEGGSWRRGGAGWLMSLVAAWGGGGGGGGGCSSGEGAGALNLEREKGGILAGRRVGNRLYFGQNELCLLWQLVRPPDNLGLYWLSDR